MAIFSFKPKVYILAAILILSAGLHFYRISYPASPVFDEAHFASYAAYYLNDRPFWDIHPPLGKILFAGALSFFPNDKFAGANFISFEHAKDGGPWVNKLDRSFGSYPYVALRIFASLFGVALALFFYLFLRSVGLGEAGALFGAFMVTFENAFILETRLILLNGMFLAFGFAALWLFFDRNKSPYLAGAMFGLSLSVKLTAITFLAPALVAAFLSGKTGDKIFWSRLKVFCTVAVALLFFGYLANFLFFSPVELLAVFYRDGFMGERFFPPASVTASSAAVQFMAATLVQWFLSFGNYTLGGIHYLQSPWYLWPAMQLPMLYYGDESRSLTLYGNPSVWFGATLSVIIAVAAVRRFIYSLVRKEKNVLPSIVLILLAGYIGSLLPFATIVHRSTFLYHYFPAYLFGIGLLALGVEKISAHKFFASSPKRQIAFFSIVALAVIGGFVTYARFTYGLPAFDFNLILN
ncbi:MAG: phospholipid carrier-dependent glycosyltransferase [Candidatus Sungbacteria bacterium]|nr:phospholipid carrier-dependent glycosyltransferase [Candidatus Sungbacteria bacterium]